ncbi:Chemotaxis phosphatase CheX [Quadrisphaera granulorum]|uniref:Chemotaxis phosphatase CheX-like protein n=1 Tax=Quadrisphaera granulorum TaxID=317664 RepID=A0A316AF93_9ACTN|nr:chemotaxis protein CheX [Quadrisphaera granulorum]PWJ55650.1 chemotaxis phosphatase CheX-like protein [Quadrisphaera granulorum]SZE95147.1 Chemotaxis phosphatase CheX [Quadrisphaera granulorum]
MSEHLLEATTQDGACTLSAAELLPEESVRAVAEEIWLSFIGEEEFLIPLDGEAPANPFSAWVGIDGPWRGRVVITCDESVAQDLTRCLLGEETVGELSQDDVEDGFGELANVVGGGLKALLPEASRLTLPLVGANPPAHGEDMFVIQSIWRGQSVDIVISSVPLQY